MNFITKWLGLLVFATLAHTVSAADQKKDWHLIAEDSEGRKAIRQADGTVSEVKVGGGEFSESNRAGQTRTVSHTVSPDGKWILYELARNDKEPKHSVAIADMNAKNWRTIADSANSIHPTWSPDGRQIAFIAEREPNVWHVYRIDMDGKNEKRISREPVSRQTRPCIAADGQVIYAIDRGRDGKLPLMDLVSGDGQKETTLVKRNYVIAAASSPDGNRLALVVPGELTIRDLKTGSVQTFPMKDVNPNWLVTYYDLLWRPDGGALAFGFGFLGGKEGGARIPGEDHVGVMTFDGGKPTIKTYRIGIEPKLYAWVTGIDLRRRK